ncbi:MFS transporter [Neobacillus vireti]|uniref:MFS transporter n=1 Tax=Neobacillus vireti TaxID=220686 RepID=UPI002FFDF5B4
METVIHKEAKPEVKMQPKSIPKLKFREKLTFGIGDFGSNFSWSFIAMFATIYLTDTVGLSAGILGTIFLICRVFDGIADIFIGTLIDKTNTKMGKAKPWVFWTTPPLAIATFLLFNVPSSLGSTGQIVYVFVLYFLVAAVFYTSNNVAYGALTSFMTTDSKDRVSLGSYRFILAILAVLVISSFTTVLVHDFGSGQRGWTITAAIYSIVCAIPLMITGWFIKERNVSDNAGHAQNISLWLTIKVLFSNKYFLIAIIMFLLMYLAQTRTSVQIYYVTYIFKRPDLMGVIALAGMLPIIIGLMFASQIVGKFGLRKSILGGQIIVAIGTIAMGIYSENLTMFIVSSVIASIGSVTLSAGIYAIVADVGDLVFWKSGVPVQGAVFSLTSVGLKIGTGLASALVGWILAYTKYVPNANVQPDSAIIGIKFLYIYFPLICTVATAIAVVFLNHEKLMPRIREEISLGQVGKNRK